MTKLTPRVLDEAFRVIGPEGKLTLTLRDRRVQYIENLEHTNDIYNVIDLTNNEIGELGSVPALANLETLLLARNNISRICELLACSVLSLLLAHNNIGSLAELCKLRTWAGLANLLLLGNPVTSVHQYRLFTIWMLPNLRVLDCEKVMAKERAQAVELFGETFEKCTPAADALLHGSGVVEPGTKDERLLKAGVKLLTETDRARLVAELEQASSMAEIDRIQEALKLGYVG